MIINTIVNRDIANLKDCESEPIHVPGSIQPHGFLLAFDAAFKVVYASDNCSVFIGIPIEKILNNRFGAIFSPAIEVALEAHLKQYGSQVAEPFVLEYQNEKYNCTLQPSGQWYLFEAEPFPDGHLRLPDLYNQTRKFVHYLQETASLQSLCQLIAVETRDITGYDRVMIYKFDEAYNGEVIAESKREDLEPFLGLHYPHTDIPPQARELYLRNLMRMIADVHYESVPILTTQHSTHRDLDLSLSVLRSVSPIHIEYLKNMGVGATLTISIINNHRLWGLISCHHYSPKNLPHYTRLSALLQGHFLASQINVRQQAEEYALAKNVEQSLEVILNITSHVHQDFIARFLTNEHSLKVVNARGMAILYDNKLHLSGTTPTEEEVYQLIGQLSQVSEGNVFYTNKLVDVYPKAEELTSSVAGLIYYPFGGYLQDCILWFRPETPQEVNWAGDPSKSIEYNPNGLSPRKSFDLWKQIKRFESRLWEKPELTAAATVFYALQTQIHLNQLTQDKIKLAQLSDKLQKAVSELENINWISTHDLKEPLRKIQTFASRILEDEHNTYAPMVIQSVTRMKDAAVRMQTLIQDLVSYSQVSKSQNQLVDTDLNKINEEVLAELASEINEKNAVVESDTLPSVKGVSFLLKQLWLNVIGNALKFSKTQIPLSIQIRCTIVEKTVEGQVKSFYQISFIDNGVGFDNEYAHQIFEVFKRIHSPSQYRGSGIGLSICKKIMENHQGFMEAQSEKNVGTIIRVYFPTVL